MDVGLIGCGGMGMSLARGLNGTGIARITAVADVDAERAGKSAAELEAQPFGSLEAMLEAAVVPAVIVASPPFLHPPHVEAALAAGRHVFVEKPLAVTLEECDSMIRAAESAGKSLMVGQVLRYYPTWRFIRERVAAGAVGRPLGVQVSRLGGGWGSYSVAWRHEQAKCGGMLMEVNAHEIDFMCDLLGEPRRVYALMDRFLDTPADYANLAYVSVQFASGALGMLHASQIAAVGDLSGRVEGEAGSIFYQDGFSGNGRITEALHDGQPTVTRVGDLTYEPPVQAELRGFIESIGAGTPPPVTAAEGRRAVAVAVAAYRSAAAGQAVEV